MRRFRAKWFVAPAIVLIAACGRSDSVSNDRAAITNDLRKDLDLAATSGIELAANDYEPRRFVSDIEQPLGHEQGRGGAPKLQPRRRATPKPSPEIVAVATDELEPEVVTIAAVPQPESPVLAPVPMPAPEPTQPARNDESEGRGSRGSGLGDIVEVVIRGGSVGVIDKCEKHGHGGRRGGFPVAINTRFPIGNPTFPRR
ncbi:MAG: hypothetical protein ABR543_07620 [Gemmatimonadaceae bacterium]